MTRTIYEKRFDVFVAGGGVSGCAAALAAARNGASVLVAEQNGYLGGSLTGCGVGPMMTFHAGEKQVIRGIMQELVEALEARGWCPGHVPDTKQYTSTVTPFFSEGLKLILDEKLREAGCTVIFHTFLGGVTAADRWISGVTVCNKDGLHQVSAKIFVDATGDGDIAAWAGEEMTKGRPEDGAAQPMTMKMKYCGVDTGRLKRWVEDHPERFPALAPHIDLFSQDIPIDLEGFEEEFRQAKAEGSLSIRRENVLMFATGRPGEYIVNTTRIVDHDAADALSLSDAERAGRLQCAELDRFLRKHLSGFENALLEFTGPSVGVRGSRQLVGKYVLTPEDILTRRSFPDRIAHSAYPIDIHNPKGEGTSSTFMSEPGSYYSIPYSIMTGLRTANLLVTGRCVSAAFEAQAAIRTTPTVGAMGQAAGTAAAMAAAGDGIVWNVDVSRLQRTLAAQGAYLEL